MNSALCFIIIWRGYPVKFIARPNAPTYSLVEEAQATRFKIKDDAWKVCRAHHLKEADIQFKEVEAR